MLTKLNTVCSIDVMKSIDIAFKIAGGPSRLAEKLCLSVQRVSNWRTRGVPTEHCPSIERATNGAVRCEDLRPDVDWAYLRKSNSEEAA